MIRRRAQWLALALALLVPLALAAPATAKKRRSQKATYTATISGTQVTTWSYRHEKRDPCDSTSRADGDQTLRFQNGEPKKVRVFRYGKGRPVFVWLPGFTPYTMRADVFRNSSFTSMNDWDPGCPTFGGGGGEEEPNDCGQRHGSLDITLSYTGQAMIDDDLIAPLPIRRNRLLIAGTGHDWGHDGGAAEPPRTGRDLETTYHSCPFWIGGPQVDAEPSGSTLLTVNRVNEGRWFERRRRRLVIDGSRVQEYSAEGFTGKTVLAFKLVFRRVRR